MIEENSSGYYTYNDSWQYQYVNGKIQTSITHTIHDNSSGGQINSINLFNYMNNNLSDAVVGNNQPTPFPTVSYGGYTSNYTSFPTSNVNTFTVSFWMKANNPVSANLAWNTIFDRDGFTIDLLNYYNLYILKAFDKAGNQFRLDDAWYYGIGASLVQVTVYVNTTAGVITSWLNGAMSDNYTTFSTQAPVNDRWCWGGYNGCTQCFNGTISNIKYYENYQPTNATASSLYQNPLYNPVTPTRWYPFLETSGTTTYDISGNNKTGTLTNSVTRVFDLPNYTNGVLTFNPSQGEYGYVLKDLGSVHTDECVQVHAKGQGVVFTTDYNGNNTNQCFNFSDWSTLQFNVTSLRIISVSINSSVGQIGSINVTDIQPFWSSNSFFGTYVGNNQPTPFPSVSYGGYSGNYTSFAPSSVNVFTVDFWMQSRNQLGNLSSNVIFDRHGFQIFLGVLSNLYVLKVNVGGTPYRIDSEYTYGVGARLVHVTVYYNATSQVLTSWLNGTMSNNYTGVTGSIVNDWWCWGGYNGSCICFNGTLSNIKYFENYQPTNATALSLYQNPFYNPVNPTRWYPFLETSGTTINDISGNNNTGTIVNSVTRVFDTPNSTGGVLNFNFSLGSYGYVMKDFGSVLTDKWIQICAEGQVVVFTTDYNGNNAYQIFNLQGGGTALFHSDSFRTLIVSIDSDYLLVGYRDGWNAISTSNGSLVPCQDSSKSNYYWIRPYKSTVTITFDVNQNYTYNGINVVTGNEPFAVFGGTQTLIRSGNTFRFTPSKLYFNVTDTLDSYTRAANEAPPGAPAQGFENPFTSIGKPSQLNASDNNYYKQGSYDCCWQTIYLKGYINPAYYASLTYWRCYQIELNYEGHAKASYSYNTQGFQCFSWGYWDPGTWCNGSNIPFQGDSDQLQGKVLTWDGADFTDKVGLGVRAYCNWVWNLWWVQSWIEMWSDHFYGTCCYESRDASILYECAPFNTNNDTSLIIKYQTSHDEPWTLYLTQGNNMTAKAIQLNGTTAGTTAVINIQDGQTYDGFYLESSNWGHWIEFDYILTGCPSEVNSLDQNGNPNLQVYPQNNSASGLGTANNSLYVVGTVREMDGYNNSVLNLNCTLELWQTDGGAPLYSANVSGAFNQSINTLSSGLVNGSYYTVDIKPYWGNIQYPEVSLNFQVYPLTLVNQSPIGVIEDVGGTYYAYNDAWGYQYAGGGGGIQVNITHTLGHSGVNYLLVGYEPGWIFNSATSGQINLSLVPYQDAGMRNYYWINLTNQTAVSAINVTFNVNQNYSYSGINVVTGNEPFTVVGGNKTTLSPSGNTFIFAPTQQNNNTVANSLYYYSGPFNTNNQPYLIVRYRTSSGYNPQNWNLYLTINGNETAKAILPSSYLPNSSNWATSVIPIKDGNTYDGFYINSTDWNQSIEFEYVLTGHHVEVNSLDQNGNPNLLIQGGSSPSNPLYVSGTVREMDGYSNPISTNLNCTLEIWKTNATSPAYSANVNGAFNQTVNNLTSGNYTAIIKPYWDANYSNYQGVERSFSLYPLNLTNDNTAPIVTITSPASDYAATTHCGVVWVNGTYNGTGSNIAKLTINDTRFGLVNVASSSSSGGLPYGSSGNFSFEASGVLAGEFAVRVSAGDEGGNVGTAVRQVLVLETDVPIVTITSTKNVFLTTDNISVNGTFSCSGSQLRSIIVSDPRFTVVMPAYPYGFSGNFSINNTEPIQMYNDTEGKLIPLFIVVEDYAGNFLVELVILVVVNPNYVNFKSPSDAQNTKDSIQSGITQSSFTVASSADDDNRPAKILIAYECINYLLFQLDVLGYSVDILVVTLAVLTAAFAALGFGVGGIVFGLFVATPLALYFTGVYLSQTYLTEIEVNWLIWWAFS